MSGYRQYIKQLDRFLGGTVYFDRDDSRGQPFEQLTVSLESIGRSHDMRLNLYMPFGADRKQTSNIFNPGSARFMGNNLVFRFHANIRPGLQGTGYGNRNSTST